MGKRWNRLVIWNMEWKCTDCMCGLVFLYLVIKRRERKQTDWLQPTVIARQKETATGLSDLPTVKRKRKKSLLHLTVETWCLRWWLTRIKVGSTCSGPLRIMRIACDTPMAICDLSFEVSSDSSPSIFIWNEVKPDFSLPMLTSCERAPAKPKLTEPASQIAPLNPATTPPHPKLSSSHSHSPL